MSDPAAATPSLLIALIAALSTIPGIDAAVVLGSFAGAIVFVLSADDVPSFKKFGYLIVSFIAGLLLAKLVAGWMTAIALHSIDVPNGVGALVAATVIVNILRWMLKQDVGEILKLIRGARP